MSKKVQDLAETTEEQGPIETEFDSESNICGLETSLSKEKNLSQSKHIIM